jgi:uncharacterized membrane protein YbhN (UPF0104 family)
VFDNLPEFRKLLQKDFSPIYILPSALSVFLFYLTSGEILRLGFLLHGVRLSFKENLSLTLASSALNYLIPFKASLGARALYLKKRHFLSFADYLSQALLISLITLVVASFFALAGIVVIGLSVPMGKPLIAVFSYFLITFLGGSLFLLWGKVPFPLPKRLSFVKESWEIMRTKRRLLIRIILFTLLYFLFWTLSNWLALSSLGLKLGLWGALFYAGGQIHSFLINVTPAGLGVMEAYGVFAGGVLGFSPAEALLGQGVLRLVTISVLLPLGFLGYLSLAFRKG